MSKKSKKLHEPSMEDINAATLAALTKLDKLGVIDTEDPAWDALFDKISAVIEKQFNYPDYSNYN